MKKTVSTTNASTSTPASATFRVAINKQGAFLLPGLGWVMPEKKKASQFIGARYAEVEAIHRMDTYGFYRGRPCTKVPTAKDLAVMFTACDRATQEALINNEIRMETGRLAVQGFQGSKPYYWDCQYQSTTPSTMLELCEKVLSVDEGNLWSAILAEAKNGPDLSCMAVVAAGKLLGLGCSLICLPGFNSRSRLIKAHVWESRDCGMTAMDLVLSHRDIDLWRTLHKANAVSLDDAAFDPDVLVVPKSMSRALREGIIFYGRTSQGKNRPLTGFGFAPSAPWKLATTWDDKSISWLVKDMARYNELSVAELNKRQDMVLDLVNYVADHLGGSVASDKEYQGRFVNEMIADELLLPRRTCDGVEYLRIAERWTDRDLAKYGAFAIRKAAKIVNATNRNANSTVAVA